MTRVKISAIVKDSKVNKGKSAKPSTADKLQASKILEEVYGTPGEKKSEWLKLMGRIEERAKNLARPLFSEIAVKAALQELRVFRRRAFVSVDLANLPKCAFDEFGIVPTFTHRGNTYHIRGNEVSGYFAEVEEIAALRDYKKCLKHLVCGFGPTEGFSKIPSKPEVDGEIKVIYKECKDIHDVITAIQRANIAIDEKKIINAAKERKEECDRISELEALRLKVMSGTATKEEIIKFATLAK